MDGIGDNADTDDDNDGWMDTDESVCGTDPRDGFVSPDDYDSDMICDVVDDDDDNDGFIDVNDVFPKNAAEWLDTDLDGLGDNEDHDDDGDGWSDHDELNCSTDPLDEILRHTDSDSDMECDFLDFDDDDDGVEDAKTYFPLTH